MTRDNEFAYNPALHLTRLLSDRLQGLLRPARQRFGERPLTAPVSYTHLDLYKRQPDEAWQLAPMTGSNCLVQEYEEEARMQTQLSTAEIPYVYCEFAELIGCLLYTSC